MQNSKFLWLHQIVPIAMDTIEDYGTKAIEVIERMIARNQANKADIERAVFKIAYPLPPET
jgi:hypothetical protein